MKPLPVHPWDVLEDTRKGLALGTDVSCKHLANTLMVPCCWLQLRLMSCSCLKFFKIKSCCCRHLEGRLPSSYCSRW